MLFCWSWLYRFNDPEGGFAGLFDDHFFYAVRGWQILYGDLPSRDFVDIGAPLTFAFAAAAQLTLGPGAWSEMVFCVTALSVASAVTYLVAWRASGSTVIALVAACLQISLQPRYYNYPKVLVYAVAIPAIWGFVDKQTRWRRVALALITAIGFLLRHDHGIFVGLAVAAALALMAHVPWRARVRHVVIYGALVMVLLAPYLVYLQINGGVINHLVVANTWSSRDRGRAPFVRPRFALMPTADEALPEGDAEWWKRGPFTVAARNAEPWLFWFLVGLPIAALLTLPLASARVRPDWPNARLKIAVVALLTILLDVGFLRGRLSSRFGDVSVPSAVLAAWLLGTWAVLIVRGLPARAASLARWRMAAVRAAGIVALALMVVPTAMVLTPAFWERLDLAGMTERPGYPFERFALLTRRLRATWPLENWSSPDLPGSMKLAFYLRDCTEPDDRVFISQYLPQVPALAQRAFAGGHPDLRPGFFSTDADQRLTIARLRTHRVPIAILPTEEEYEGFRKDFPRVDAYFATDYRDAGEIDFEDGARVRVFVRRDLTPVRTYEPLQRPCFR